MKALVLSGGGAKGCFQVGALQYLIKECGIDFDIVCGVSVGALNGALVAQGDFDLLQEIWLNLRSPKDVFRKRFGGIIAAILGKDSLYDNTPLWKLIDKYVDQEKIINSGRLLNIGVVSLYTGEYYNITQSHSSLKKHILASTTIPIAFSPINVSADYMSMVDGGVRNMTPLKTAIELGANEIYVILCSPLKPVIGEKDYGDAIPIALRTLDLLTNEIYNNDIDTCLSYNKREGKRKVDLMLIRPESPVCETLDFTEDAIRIGMEDGYWRAIHGEWLK